MMAAWMVQALLVGGLLAVAAWAADALLALYRMPRRWAWVAAALLAVVLPVLALLPGAEPAAGPAPLAVTGEWVETGVAAHAAAGWDDVVASRFSELNRRLTVATAIPALDRLLAGLWVVVAAALLALLGWTMLRFRLARGRWREAVVAGTPVLVTGDDGPAVIGVLRPSIIVPAWLLDADAERQRMVVLHEREHVRRGDHALLAGAAVLAAALPWNLPLQWVLRRLRVAVEIDCDRRVLAAGAPPRAYGALLIDMAAQTRRMPLAVAHLARGESDLERRIRAMTWKMPRFRPLRAAGGALAAAALVLVACEVDLLDPALQDATVGDVVNSAVTADAGMATMAAQARFFVDGREVSLDDIRELPVQQFAHVEVLKADASASGAAEVRIRTAEYVAARADVATAEAERAARMRAARAQRQAEVDAEIARVVAAAPARADGPRPAGTPVRPAAPEIRVAPPGAAALRLDGVVVTGAQREPVATQAPRAAGVRSLEGVRVLPAAGNEPLYIVDGVIISHGQLNLDALDIEQIEIIKGAAAARLYGSRAANGIVNITTKR